MDYIFRRLALDYLPFEKREALGIFTADERIAEVAGYDQVPAPAAQIAAVVSAELSAMSFADTEVPTVAKADMAATRAAVPASQRGTGQAHSSAELLEQITGKVSDAPLCMTCGIKMRPAGSCYVCEGCGSTSGCS
jgi:ribonucleoside-diphosphate reductase alpha chain